MLYIIAKKTYTVYTCCETFVLDPYTTNPVNSYLTYFLRSGKKKQCQNKKENTLNYRPSDEAKEAAQ